jgi:hypothetical protein
MKTSLHAALVVLLALLRLGAAETPAATRPVDVYLLGGQSNMQGIGAVKDLADADRRPCTNAYFWTGGTFTTLVPGETKTSQRVGEFGPEITFARAMAEQSPGRDIYVVKFALGGQPLHHGWDGYDWKGETPAPKRKNFYPGENAGDPNTGQHYRAMAGVFDRALGDLRARRVSFTVRGFVWMQGEQDAKHAVSAAEYPTSLKRLKRRLEEDSGAKSLPFVFGQVLPHDPPLPRFTHRAELRQSQRHADEASGHANAIPGVKMVSTDGLPLKADTVHYDAAGLAKLGRDFAAVMIKLQEKLPARSAQ